MVVNVHVSSSQQWAVADDHISVQQGAVVSAESSSVQQGVVAAEPISVSDILQSLEDQLQGNIFNINITVK